MKLKKRNKTDEAKEVVKKAAPVKKSKKATLATVCTRVILENPKAAFQTLCKKAEDKFKESGALSYLVINALNDALDSIVEVNNFDAEIAKAEAAKDKAKTKKK